jgi:hypothetical protein
MTGDRQEIANRVIAVRRCISGRVNDADQAAGFVIDIGHT